MKVRNGFVSNSSSSSFIVVGGDPPKDLVQKLTDKQKDLLLRDWSKNNNSKFGAIDHGYRIEKEDIEESDLYITRYISDTDDSIELDNLQMILYAAGSHNYPYSEEDFEEIGEDIWLRNKHVRKATEKSIELREKQLKGMCEAVKGWAESMRQNGAIVYGEDPESDAYVDTTDSEACAILAELKGV